MPLSRHIAILTAAGAALALALPGSASAATCADADALPGSQAFVATAPTTTLCLLNNERAAAGLAPLREGPSELEAPALAYSRDMVERKFFGHESPDGVKLLQRLASYTIGSAWTVGENLAWGEGELGTPASIVRAWMNSPGHRRNILDGTFEEIGIGIVPGAPQTVSRPSATYTTEFGSRQLGSAAPIADEVPTGSTAGKRSTTKKPRCRRVYKKVRRNGRTVRVKKLVCPKKTKKQKTTISARRRA